MTCPESPTRRSSATACTPSSSVPEQAADVGRRLDRCRFRSGHGAHHPAFARGRLHTCYPGRRGRRPAVIRRILAVTVKELLQLKRDWRTALALLGMPVVLLLIYGYALSFDIRDIRLAVVDQSRTRAAREVVQAFLGKRLLRARRDPRRRAAARRALRLWRGAGGAGDPCPTSAPRRRPPADRPAVRARRLRFPDRQHDPRLCAPDRRHGRARPAWRSTWSRRSAGLPLVWYNPDLKSSLFLVRVCSHSSSW